MERIDARILDELLRIENQELSAADSLDVKASIVLLLTTFLATESTYFIDKHLAGMALKIEIAAIAFSAISLILAIIELWPRTYSLPSASSTVDRVNELEAFYTEDFAQEGWARIDQATVLQFTDDQIKWCRDRLSRNQKNNRVKARWLNWAFYSCVVSLSLNLITLLKLATTLH